MLSIISTLDWGLDSPTLCWLFLCPVFFFCRRMWCWQQGRTNSFGGYLAVQRACLDLLQQFDLLWELCLLAQRPFSETANNGMSKCHKHILSVTCPSSGPQGHVPSCRIHMSGFIPWWSVSGECSQLFHLALSWNTGTETELNKVRPSAVCFGSSSLGICRQLAMASHIPAVVSGHIFLQPKFMRVVRETSREKANWI